MTAYAKRGYCHGEAHPHAKMTASDVRLARGMYRAGDRWRGCSSLARLFGVSQPTMRQCLLRITWAHV